MPATSELLAALRASEDPDAMVLLQLAEIGADLRKPHEPEFTFEVAKRSSAEAIAKELRELGYDVQLFEPEDNHADYQVIAKHVMLLDLKVLNKLSREFESTTVGVPRLLNEDRNPYLRRILSRLFLGNTMCNRGEK